MWTFLSVDGSTIYSEYLAPLPNPVPIPPTVTLLGSGLLGLAGWRLFMKGYSAFSTYKTNQGRVAMAPPWFGYSMAANSTERNKKVIDEVWLKVPYRRMSGTSRSETIFGWK
jgi:hypothetical protein